ncbi:MAG: hypothetical protein OHK0048_03060 [Rhodoferax sp.]
MAKWAAFPYAGEYPFDEERVQRQWALLHATDLEPLPSDVQLLKGWAEFHSGQFQAAARRGLKLGPKGFNLANKATCVYATYLEPKEERRLALFLEVAQRAEKQIAANSADLNAYYWRAYALSRYSQGMSVAKTLAQGLGVKIKSDLEKIIRHQPNHLDACVALGTFHAEVIDKVGALIGAMAFGVSKETGKSLFSRAVQLNIESALCLVDQAQALLMLEGEAMLNEAMRLYRKAAGIEPLDAAQRLEVEMARARLAEI